jgi:hypothetical protein
VLVEIKSGSVASRFTAATPWVRVDGTVVADTGPALFDGTELRSFINEHADGTYVADVDLQGTTLTGAPSPTVSGSVSSTCNDWTSTTNGAPNLGFVGRVVSSELWGNVGLGPSTGFCTTTTYSLLCLQP